jgi:hypothetical protein
MRPSLQLKCLKQAHSITYSVATLAYKLVVFLIGLPNYLQRMYAFISDARDSWTVWYANTKKWFGDIFSVVLYCIRT